MDIKIDNKLLELSTDTHVVTPDEIEEKANEELARNEESIKNDVETGDKYKALSKIEILEGELQIFREGFEPKEEETVEEPTVDEPITNEIIDTEAIEVVK